MKYYTYMWIRSNGTPYYIGKGCRNRAFIVHRNKRVPVPERARIVIQYWASEQEAYEMEKWYIQFYGRKDLGTGILRNMTDGGEGGSQTGIKRGAITRLRMKNYANNRSVEHLEKIAQSKIGKPLPALIRAKISDTVSKTLRAQWAAGKYAGRKLVPWNKGRKKAA